MSASISRDEWLKALTEAGLNEEDDQEAVTIGEFAALLNVPVQTAQSQMNKLVRLGKARRTTKRGVTSYGRHISFTAYRLA